MGDRGQIRVRDGGSEVILYTHWGASDLETTLASALKRGCSRWNDCSYLARIIFCEMVRDDIEGLTGFGIQTRSSTDSEKDIVVQRGVIEVIEGGRVTWTGSFDEFLKKYGD